MSAHTPVLQQANLLTGRQMVMLAIIALHALLISALMAMRIIPDAQKVEVPIVGHIDPPRIIPLPPPELPEPVVISPITTTTVPVIDLIIPADEVTVPYVPPKQTGPVADLVAPTGTEDVIAPVIPATALQFRAVRPADDYYPSASLSLQEEGAAVVQVCVAPSGRLEGSPVIQQSSGSRRLDAAALKWAGEALRFTPATRGGVPVSACKGFRVHFRLH